MEAADGDLIVSLDADSVYSDQFLMALITPFTEHEDVTLTYGPCYGEQPLHVDASIRLTLQFGFPLVGLYWVSGANRAFKKSAFRTVGGYDCSKDSKSIFHVMAEEQIRFPLRLAEEGEIGFVSEATAVQSSRTLKQLLLVGRKNGGRDWSILHHYRLFDRLKELGR